MSMKKGLKDKIDSTTNSMKDKLNGLDNIVNEKKIDRQQAKYEKERQKKEAGKKLFIGGGIIFAALFMIIVVMLLFEDELAQVTNESAAVLSTEVKEESSVSPKKESNDISDEKNEIGSEEIPISIFNCPDLVSMLSLHATYDIAYVSFAQKYSNDYIEFDGHIQYVSSEYNDDNKYVYKILICGGDYMGPNKAPTGPNFQAKDVTSSAFGHTGMSTEEEIKVGNNIKIKARVGKFDKNAELFYLENFTAELR